MRRSEAFLEEAGGKEDVGKRPSEVDGRAQHRTKSCALCASSRRVTRLSA